MLLAEEEALDQSDQRKGGPLLMQIVFLKIRNHNVFGCDRCHWGRGINLIQLIDKNKL